MTETTKQVIEYVVNALADAVVTRFKRVEDRLARLETKSADPKKIDKPDRYYYTIRHPNAPPELLFESRQHAQEYYGFTAHIGRLKVVE